MAKAQNNRIVHVPRRFAQDEWGGTESVILNFCRQQLERGLAPEIHTSRALCPTPNEIWRHIPVFRYRYCYPFLGLSKAEIQSLDKKGGNLLSLQLFWKLAMRPGVRIFHAHVLKRMGGAVFRAAQLKGVPFVVNLHGNIFDVPEDEAASVVEAQQGHFEWGKPFGMLFGSRQLLEKANAVICVGFSEYEAAGKALSHDRVYHLPNGVNVDHFTGNGGNRTRRDLAIPEDAFLFGCISRIDPQKNQALLIRSFNRIAAKYPQAHLLVSGPETLPEYGKELRRLATEAGFGERIHFAGPVEPESDAHAGLFDALDVFVLPSRHEPFGIVALEAWAARKPLIASKVGGLRHFVENDVNGLAIDSGDEEGLARSMKRFMDQPGLADTFASAGRRLVESTYSWQQVVADLEEIYRKAEEHKYESTKS